MIQISNKVLEKEKISLLFRRITTTAHLTQIFNRNDGTHFLFPNGDDGINFLFKNRDCCTNFCPNKYHHEFQSYSK